MQKESLRAKIINRNKGVTSLSDYAAGRNFRLVAVGSTPEEFEQLVRKDMQSMARLVETTGLSAE